MKTKHIVIAASGRKAGKTLLARGLIETVGSLGMGCVYIKLRRRPRTGLKVLSGPGAPGTDTHRCMEAGAVQAVLVEYGEVSELSAYAPGLPSMDALVVWETNSAADWVNPDALLYLEVEPGKGKNPELALRADLVISAPLMDMPSRELCGMALGAAGIPGSNTGLKPGMEEHLDCERENNDCL